mmetsp:Transcript_22154/g.33155  ORF Transcript_22154/g.33155 Transcript_22154/m.33155 type:complete len:465 (-) Transcript_22154:238-1632(-)
MVFVVEEAKTFILVSSAATANTIASTLIIFIIIRSERKLSSVYHRIMFMMSIANILFTVAVALATLPMPAKFAEDGEENHLSKIDWAGPRIGNSVTCTIQGFFWIFGSMAAFSYYICLCIYYTCAIAFRMKERTIVKCVEPIMHFVTLAYSFVIALLPITESAYSPTPHDTTCTIMGAETGENSGPALDVATKYTTIINIYIFASFIVIIICFALIIRKVVKVERMISRMSASLAKRNIKRQSSFVTLNKLEKSHSSTKVILVQSLSYILALFISLSFTLARAFVDESNWLILVSLVFGEFCGIFNVIIFVSHKIHNYRRVHPETSRCRVIQLLFKGAASDEIYFSRISVVRFNEKQEMEYELEDELHQHFVEQWDVPDKEDGSDGSDAREAMADDEESKRDLSGFSSSSQNIDMRFEGGSSLGLLIHDEEDVKSHFKGSTNADSSLALTKSSSPTNDNNDLVA